MEMQSEASEENATKKRGRRDLENFDLNLN
jgi:hypothetical protein